MKRLTPIALAVCMLLASPLVAEENASTEGIWTMTSMKIKGKERSRNRDNSLTVSDGEFTIQVGMPQIRVTYKLDNAQTPKHFDTIAEIDGSEFPTLGIYKSDATCS